MQQIVQELLAFKGLVVAFWLALFFVGERLFPADPDAPRGSAGRARLIRNGGLFLVNMGLSLSVVIPVSVWAAQTAPDWRAAVAPWWSGWVGLVLDLLLLDFLIYWWHRANHEIPALWRFHEVHHLDAHLDSSSAVRFHFGEVLLSALVRACVILLLDIPLASVLVFEALVLLAAIFHHSNLRLPAGVETALGPVIITPAQHWVHHHKIRRDTDSTYGTVLSLWDRLFRTRSATKRRAGMPIGVEGREERGWIRLILTPFMRGG
ncbi:sterol desaturase family protein [Marivibrio halodurans]|uniref:Sterol desaturase family protein n=1 Tax=Marivibrio halodurans TaxID=2039722 RepID=A0A8J7V3D3_9PROT|nr:sterol desaturase family protein [Marivibrio halodurans]MBP5858116.1 sterol desaturase family protein [Marivibrio halodurans]